MDSSLQITNLLYRYAELIDAGDLVGVASLFDSADVTMARGVVVHGSAPILETLRSFVRIYPCGTPRTKHVVTNPIIEIEEAAGTATCRSYYTVLQQTDLLPLQVIVAGRYHDSFVREGGTWRFASRDYSLIDMTGDMSQHQLLPVPAKGN